MQLTSGGLYARFARFSMRRLQLIPVLGAPRRTVRSVIRNGILVVGGLAFWAAACIHLGTFLGYRLLPEGREQILAVGAAVLWVGTVVALTGGAQLWKAATWQQLSIEGVPAWLRYVLFVVLCYGVINFILVPLKRRDVVGETERALLYLRLWSGHVLFMYLAPLVAVYSAKRIEGGRAQSAAAGA
jgi:hypothetical protein